MKNNSSILKCILLCNVLLIFACTGKTQEVDKKIIRNDSAKIVICFVYHRVGDSRYPTTNVSIKDFDSHLNWLTKNNYTLLTFSDAISYLQSDEPTQKIAVITIDDGYKSFFKNGIPLLKKYKIPATLFINTETVGAGDYMDWSMLKIAMKDGIEIGNHTHSHAYFLNESTATRYKTFKDEIELSQSIIQKNLNFTPVTFTYPYGEFDVEMKNIAKRVGFKAAAAQNSGVVCSRTDLFMCPRFPMSESYSSLNKFVEKASSRPLKILQRSPDSFELPANKKPILKLTIQSSDLRLDQIQCFVQGGKCSFKITEKNDDTATVTFQSTTPITGRRRTLYTITVPDHKDVWHWYSHLWINPNIKE
jgi:peptidoglycan/xylan/chitin deacetylase (PgdA/CDA1 family)